MLQGSCYNITICLVIILGNTLAEIYHHRFDLNKMYAKCALYEYQLSYQGLH